jgi:hypothetical protein
MKSIKYTLIFISLLAIYYIWGFIAALIEHGLPEYPVYYIASILEMVLGYLTYKFTKTEIAKQHRLLIGLVYVLCFGIPIALYYSKTGILWQVAGSQQWYILSTLGFFGFNYIKQQNLKKKLVEDLAETELVVESYSKGLFWFVLIMVILFAPILISVFLVILLS